MNLDRGRTELFDVPADPMEVNNAAEKHSAIANRLADRVISWQETLPDGPIHPDTGSNAYPWPGCA